MAFGIKGSKLVVLLLNYAAYIEKKGSSFGIQSLPPPNIEAISAKKAELNDLMEEMTKLNEDFDMTVRLIQRFSTESEKSPANMIVGKKYVSLLIEKSDRVDQRKKRIKKLLDDI
jgi:hypothetical protein